MADYAIIESGAKQYRVEANSILDVELLGVEEGKKEVTLDKVLFVREGEKVTVGTPLVENAKVVCDFLGDVKGKKLISFKMRRRKNSRSKIGHRQQYSRIQVKEIVA